MLNHAHETARDRFEDATIAPATPVFSPALKAALDALESELRDFLVAERLCNDRPANA